MRATTLYDGLYFGEAPRWHNGRLWLSDFYDHAVLAVDANGQVERMVEVPGQPSGLGWLPDGRLLVVSMLDRRILRLDPDGLVEHADLSGLATFHANDMLVDGLGRAYIGNFGFDYRKGATPQTAILARVDPDGAVHVAATGLRFPNGTVLTPDGGTLIVAESHGRQLTAFDVLPDGGLTHRHIWAETPSLAPDGMALDAEGAVWVANAEAAECVRVGEGGVILGRVVTSQRCMACALGGERRDLLFLTTAQGGGEVARAQRRGKIEVVQVEVPGVGWP